MQFQASLCVPGQPGLKEPEPDRLAAEFGLFGKIDFGTSVVDLGTWAFPLVDALLNPWV